MKNSEKLLTLISRRGWKVATLAEKADIKYTTLKSLIDRDLRNITVAQALSISQALDIKVSDFIQEAAPMTDENSYLNPPIGFKVKEAKSVYETTSNKRSLSILNYYGQISAGELTSINSIEKEDVIELPKSMLGKYADRLGAFMMRVNGDSMDKIIPNNSYVVCIPVEEHELHDNDIVIYSYNNESSMKRFSVRGDYVVFSPESNNPRYFDFAISKDTENEVEILAKVILYAVTLG
ncbi:helix-turn-helix domain-containing protein [Lysinibacillus sp. NPDC059133]|uniref:helix-turn-helix domain-containing protein n=1 Tax=Lysinibacillus sp. NPDC059133 TaxID=3346737 RepID=UPI0036CC2059